MKLGGLVVTAVLVMVAIVIVLDLQKRQQRIGGVENRKAPPPAIPPGKDFVIQTDKFSAALNLTSLGFGRLDGARAPAGPGSGDDLLEPTMF